MLLGILYSALAALGDIVGGALVLWRTGRDRRAIAALTGFGAGFMLALVIIGMLPEALAMEGLGGVVGVLVGYLVVHLTQHTLTPHFHFGEETHDDAMVSRGIGAWALVGLLPHSFFDGVAISSGFLAENQSLGLLIFAGILLHKVPTGVSLASVVLASGNTRRQAFLAVLAIAAATVIGAIVTTVAPPLEHYGIALAAGVTLYVAASNLMPEAQHERSWSMQGGVFAGVLGYFLLHALLPGVH